MRMDSRERVGRFSDTMASFQTLDRCSLPRITVSFVSERIESAKQRAEFDSFGFTFLGSTMPLFSKRWTVDRNRNLYFVTLGGGGELPYLLRLVEKDSITINLEGSEEAKGGMQPHSLEVFWKITRIEIPAAHASRADEFMQWIREALVAHGHFGYIELTKKTDFSLTQPRFI
jgi:hypothetical protein